MVSSPWPLDKIQGFLLRGYNMSFVRHIALSVASGQVAAARAVLAAMVAPGDDGPKLTTAEPWGPVKPVYALSIGFTFGGLQKLAPDPDALKVFQSVADFKPFALGSASRASYVGDVGASAPENWTLDDGKFDVMISLYVNSETALGQMMQILVTALGTAFDPPSADRIFDTQTLYDGQVYFGYEDGIGQPIIDGSPFSSEPDGGQDLVDPGAFMLGTATSAYYNLPPTQPPVLGKYGCFGAFRVLRQHVEDFEAQAEALAAKYQTRLGITDKAIAVKAIKALICGRWPNGTPLSVFPIQGDKEPQPLPTQKINDFTYTLADGSMDRGTICPVGSHARRGNMRLADPNNSNPSFAGAPSKNHRILRRAMPYQLPYRPKAREDPDTERGLCGFFLGTSFLEQFEFVQANWIDHSFYTDLAGYADPLVGTVDPVALGTPATPGDFKTSIRPVASCVTTKASAYLFFPGTDGIAWIAAG
ncbi:MAG: hypothetical protein JWO81_2547 [Alphaproteobacteria bacterium]|nr:hypothetical protein [Alphaproteobacteria bacterium]